MKQFQEMIVKNVDRYLALEVKELKIHFEETWSKCFCGDDLNEEEIERDEIFNNLFSIFMMESKTMEKSSIVYEMFRNLNFRMDEIIYFIKADILHGFNVFLKRS